MNYASARCFTTALMCIKINLKHCGVDGFCHHRHIQATLLHCQLCRLKTSTKFLQCPEQHFFFLRRYVTGHECPLPGIIKCLVEKCLLCLSTNVSNLRATDFCSHTEYMPFVALHTVTCITKHASCDLGIICAGRQSLDIHILVIHWARQSTLFKNLDCLFFSVSFSIT